MKNWCFWTEVLEKTLDGPLDCKEIKPVNPKGNQSWIFIGRTDAKAEAPIVWPPDSKSWLTGKDPDAGKDWRQGEKDMTEDAMVGWHHWLNGHRFEPTLGDSEGQGGLECCSPWGHKSWTQLSNWTTAATKLLHGAGIKLLLKASWELCLGFCLLGCMTESHPPLPAFGTLWSIPKQLTFYLKLAALSAIITGNPSAWISILKQSTALSTCGWTSSFLRAHKASDRYFKRKIRSMVFCQCKMLASLTTNLVPYSSSIIITISMLHQTIFFLRHFNWGFKFKLLVFSLVLVAQLCPTLFNPMDCSLPDSSVHGISQARILEWVAISFSRGS